jgi:hypothetical protein
MFSPLAATSLEFIGLVRRIGKLLACFRLTVYSSYRRLLPGHDLVSYYYCCRMPSRTPPTGRGVCHARGRAESRSAALYVNPTSWLAARPRHRSPGCRRQWWAGDRPQLASTTSTSRARHRAALTFSADHIRLRGEHLLLPFFPELSDLSWSGISHLTELV